MIRRLPLTLALVAAAWAAPAAVANQLDVEAPIDLSLKEADLSQTLRSMAVILGLEPDLDPAIDGAVTVELKSVAWAQALSRICRDHQLLCEIADQVRLRVRPRPPDLGPRSVARPDAISIALRRADLRATLTSFGRIAGFEVAIEPAVRGTVTLHLDNAPWPRALEEICRLGACAVVWGEQRLAIVDDPAAPDPLLSLRFERASLARALAGALTRPRPGPDLALEIDPDLGAQTIDLEVQAATWTELLDAACRQAGCSWLLTFDAQGRRTVRLDSLRTLLAVPVDLEAFDGPLRAAGERLARAAGLGLRIGAGLDGDRPLYLEAMTATPWRRAADALCAPLDCQWAVVSRTLELAPRVPPLATAPPQGARAPRLTVRFTPPGDAPAVSHRLRFSWAKTVHRLAAGDWRLVLAWLPFGDGRQAVLPLLRGCGAAAGDALQVLGPVSLPLAARWETRAAGAVVSLAALGDEGPLDASLPPARCGTPAAPAPVTVAVVGRTSARLDLLVEPGRSLLITPPPASPSDLPPPAAALVALGEDQDGAALLALVRPDGDGFDVERLRVGDEAQEVPIATAGGGTLVLRLAR